MNNHNMMQSTALWSGSMTFLCLIYWTLLAYAYEATRTKQRKCIREWILWLGEDTEEKDGMEKIRIIPDLKKAVSLYQDFIHKTTYELHKYKWCTAEDGALHLFFYGRKSAMPEKSNSVPPQQGRLPSSPFHLMPMKQAITQNVCAWQSSH